MRTFSRMQHVVSTIICRCSHFSRTGGAKQGEFFEEQSRDDIVPNCSGDAIGGLYRAAHCSQRMNQSHNGPLPRSKGIAVAERVFPVLLESLVPVCWCDVIVAGRSRKSSASFAFPGRVRPPASTRTPWR